MQIVQNLGIILSFGPGEREAELSFSQLSDACERGFRAISRGKKGLWMELAEIQARSASPNPGFYTDFGMFARWCVRVSEDSRFTVVIDEITQFAFQNYAMRKDEELCGRLCPERKWHNCSSASIEYGASPSRMFRLLEALDLGVKRNGKNRVLRVEDGDTVLPDILRCIRRIECIRRHSIHHDMFDKLVASNFIRPAYKTPKVAPLFNPDEINLFMSQLQKKSRPVVTASAGMLTLRSTCNAAICNFEELLPKLLSGALKKTEWVSSETGLRALRFDLEDARDALEDAPAAGFTKEMLPATLCVNGPTVKMLIDTQKLKARDVKHHRSRRPMKVVEEAEVYSFLDIYVSLGELAKKARYSGQLGCSKARKGQHSPHSDAFKI
ncbi:hypothetical protein [Roseobacter denitrificans]|nr:hypothetical protein [Roseobacter denitrificans]SFF73028.1 hypothetical protein SAMN05443635_101481 [Roseobacter denitrificans OCh 114]